MSYYFNVYKKGEFFKAFVHKREAERAHRILSKVLKIENCYFEEL